MNNYNVTVLRNSKELVISVPAENMLRAMIIADRVYKYPITDIQLRPNKL